MPCFLMTARVKMDFKKERRKILACFLNWVAAFGIASSWPLRQAISKNNEPYQGDVMKLPPAKTKGTIAVETAIKQRRTVRSYKPQILSLEQFSQLLWSAQGITETNGFKRGSPSAGALYPMDVYAVAGQDSVEQMEAGVAGAFHDSKLIKAMKIPRSHEPLLIMPVGYAG